MTEKKTTIKELENQKIKPNEKITSPQLMKLFEDGIKDIYWAEKALSKAMPEMIKKATSEELSEAIKGHQAETLEHVNRLNRIFEILGKKVVGIKCEAMEGLLHETNRIMKDCDKGQMRDAGIISAILKIEYYEMASYSILSQFAKALSLSEVVKLLDSNMKEDKNAGEKLSRIVTSTIIMDSK